MKKTNLFLLPFCALFLFSTCKKEEPENCSPTSEIPGTLDSLGLPPVTTIGANTMGCLINGEPWLPLERDIFGNLVYDFTFIVGDSSSGGGISVQGRQDYNNLQSVINFSAFPVQQIGTFDPEYFGNEYINDATNCGFYDIDQNYLNDFIEITRIDFDEEVISGRFEMRLINNECDTLLVTQGRFDLSP